MVADGHVTEETLKEAFKLVSQGTLAQGAVLEIKTMKNFILSQETVNIPQTKVLEIEVEEG